MAAALFGGELASAPIELRRHVGGFFRRTTKCNQNFCKPGNFHKNPTADDHTIGEWRTHPISTGVLRTNRRPKNHFTESAGTILTLIRDCLVTGRSPESG